MPFPIAAALLGGATLGAAGLGIWGQHRSNRMSEASTREQMAFQERMSSTAFQRARADREAAGINPYYALGSGASTPSGSSFTAQNEFGAAASTALDVVRAKADIDNLRAQNAKIRSDTEVNNVMKQVLLKDIQVKSSTARKLDQDVQKGSFEAAVSGAKSGVFDFIKDAFLGKVSLKFKPRGGK